MFFNACCFIRLLFFRHQFKQFPQPDDQPLIADWTTNAWIMWRDPSCLIFRISWLFMYPVSGWISNPAHLLSGIQPDIWFAVRYLSRYPVSGRISVSRFSEYLVPGLQICRISIKFEIPFTAINYKAIEILFEIVIPS